ncbi:MAG: 30S ribosomal protein S7 [Bacteroidota bacterium]|nr:30S ribosomal protein S7 [Bacteroidota bacterium]
MRKGSPKKRYILPDPVFNEVMVTKFVNNLMLNGKKNKSFKIYYNALDIVGSKIKDDEKSPLDIWKKAIENVTPSVEVKSRRIGGATFQVPMEIRSERKLAISMKNLILFARRRKGKGMAIRLAEEIIAAYNEEGGAFKRKEEIHRMADANKAFAHFRM